MASVLYLGKPGRVLDFLRDETGTLTVEEYALPPKPPEIYDLVVSYGYRHWIPTAWCRAFDGKAVNLHISYLPWNRGADPNLWSWVDGTTKGVSLHYVSPDFDRGDLVARIEVPMDPAEHTLRSSYELLSRSVEDLFFQYYMPLLQGLAPRKPQVGLGSYHRQEDKERIELPLGWDTPVSTLTPS